MAVPVVTCGADIVKTYSVGTHSVSLSVTATNSPTSYAWTILSVPTGSTALTETRGDFINGVASVQNPDFVTDAGIEGSYVVECVATNADGDSDSSSKDAQQVVIVKTELYDLSLPNDYQYDWGSYHNNNFLLLETAISGAVGSHALGGASHTTDTLANLNAKISDATLDDSSDTRDPNSHALGGAAHSSATLAQLNALVSDATLIDTADSRLSDDRDPTNHALGGSAHTSSTLAQLNALVSDATLDDSSDTRDPNSHALGGGSHSSATLAELNALVSDATLIDTGDSRLSDSRDPNSHALGGGLHSSATLAQLNALVSDATLIDTGDSRLSDSRTPTSHATSHENGQSDEISVSGLSGLLADDQNPVAHASDHQSGGGDAIKLDDLATPDDNTDLDVSISVHGLCPKLDNDNAHFLNGQGGWTAPAGGGAHAATHDDGGGDELTVQDLGAGATASGYLIETDGGGGWNLFPSPGPGGGEANTASNVGSGGVGVYKQKTLLDLEFKNINAGSNKVSVTDDAGNNEIDIDLNEANIVHDNLSGKGSNTHAQIDSHLGSTANPHSTDIGNLGSGTLAELNTAVSDATLDDSSASRTPSAHASSHDDGGGDELTVQDLGSGVVASGQMIESDGGGGWNLIATPAGAGGHASSHNDGGGDEVTAQDLGAGATASGLIMETDGGGGWNLLTTPTGSSYTPDTRGPQGTWQSTSTVDFAAAPNDLSSTVRVTLQDGTQYSFSGTLNWDISNGVGNLGYDEAGSQGNSKWLYWYLVQDTGTTLTVKASDNDPSTGPAGHSNYVLVWEDYIDGSGNLYKVYQRASNLAIFEYAHMIYHSIGSGTDGSPQTLSLTSDVPATAESAEIRAYVAGSGGYSQLQIWADGDSASTPCRLLCFNLAGQSTDFNSGYVPMPTSNKRLYYKRSTGGTVDDAAVYTAGWASESIKP